MKKLKIFLELGKVRITFAVALTTITGYLLARGAFDSGLILPTLGIFILACGSSALNHYQERDKDALMERTSDRPIPSGEISNTGALLFGIILTIIGSLVIYFGSGFLEMQLGLLALIWYNGIYTPLKRKTAFAVIPGAVIGAIPPVVGWVAGGGSLSDPGALILATFFFIWQVPHFWLLMLRYGKQYEKAGLPSITNIYSEGQIRNITFIWVLATAFSAMLLPLFKVTQSRIILIGLVLASIWLIYEFASLLTRRSQPLDPFHYFMRINYFVLVVIILLSISPFVEV